MQLFSAITNTTPGTNSPEESVLQPTGKRTQTTVHFSTYNLTTPVVQLFPPYWLLPVYLVCIGIIMAQLT